MKISYKYRLSLVILAIFVVFSVCLILVEQNEERKQKVEAIEKQLADYVDIIEKQIKTENLSDTSISQIKLLEKLLPENLRITIVSQDGKVLYDRDFTDVSTLENHLNRPEFLKAKYGNFGTGIRHSVSTNRDYLYYAAFFAPYFVRVALPYNVQTKSLLKPDNFFIYIVLSLFILVLWAVNLIAGRFGKSILQLKNFASKLKNEQPTEKIAFPADELGEIGQNLVEIFQQKETAYRTAETEKEKLLQHFQHSDRGIAIFDSNFKKIFANSHFIQNQNLILNKPTFDVEKIFEDENFAPLKTFIAAVYHCGIDLQAAEKDIDKKYHSFQIEKDGKIFEIQAIIFDDKNLEINIKDITQIEKNHLLKQGMTNNIVHELSTPVTSIRGYLETLNEQNLSPEKREQFMQRAYVQSVRLSALIDDVSLLSKIEENSTKFPMEIINLSQLLNDVRIDLSDKLHDKNISLQITVNEQYTVNGNYTLLYSVFRNLMDNSIAYAGKNIEIQINNYLRDENFFYFSYSDNGVGVCEQHLNRLFERFYRIHEGRSRENGGSGLGLSIVKNAIRLHGGEIHARARKGGGLEFLFTIRK